jgi:uncharacterized protein YigE (DUF2233 family)
VTPLAATVIALAMAVVVAPATTLHAQLRVRAKAEAGPWREWWLPGSAPQVWNGPSPVLIAATRWRVASPGVELSEVAISGAGEAWRTKVVLVRLDVSRVSLLLDADVSTDGSVHPWTINATPGARGAAVALNGGQFSDAGPWGWIVHEGREVQAPGRGALAGALVVRADGSAQIVDADSLQAMRSSALRSPIQEAMQSYPALLTTGGRVPAALRDDNNSGVSIDLRHRDARLAVGELRDGRLIIALTRFDGFGAMLDRVPLGLTVPEMAALMGGLGCHRALMLDGGISAQLAVREGARGRREWTGLRRVPLGVIVHPRRAR